MKCSATKRCTRFTARTYPIPTSSTTASCVWTVPSLEDYDSYIQTFVTDGAYLTIAYDDSATGSSFTPSSVLTSNSTGNTGEGVSWAISVTSPPPATGVALNWVSAT